MSEIISGINELVDAFDGFYPPIIETKHLKPVATAIIPARTRSFDMVAFYLCSTSLYIYGTSADYLGLRTRRVNSSPARPYVASLLKANVKERDIRKELPEAHLSTPEDILSLMELQPNEESGLLLNNGYANVFFVEGKNSEVFVVNVHWDANYGKWRFGVWLLNEIPWWGAGGQVLCPGTAAL